MIPHDPNEDIAASDRLGKSHGWLVLYQTAYPRDGFVDHDYVDALDEQGLTLQRSGIDRYLLRVDGSRVAVEEKVRKRDYGDFLLEVVSNTKTGALGWMERELDCDLFAYYVQPIRTAWIFAYPRLKQEWATWGMHWREKYKEKASQNPGYQTLNVPVPRDELLAHCDSHVRCVRFTPRIGWRRVPA